MYLTVVIPCYNEEKNIKRGKVNQVIEFLSKQSFKSEVIIVDDGSTDSSKLLLKKIRNIKLIENTHQGKAATVITGMLKGQGEYVLFTDLDQATPINEINKFIQFFNKKIDVVIGTRRDSRKGAPFVRAIMGPGFTLLRKFILGLDKISDTQCGFKAFKKEVAQDIFSRLKLYKDTHNIKDSQVTAGFDVEVLFLASKLGYSIKEVPVKWNYVETRRVNPLKDSLLALSDLIKIRLNSISGLYNY